MNDNKLISSKVVGCQSKQFWKYFFKSLAWIISIIVIIGGLFWQYGCKDVEVGSIPLGETSIQTSEPSDDESNIADREIVVEEYTCLNERDLKALLYDKKIKGKR